METERKGRVASVGTFDGLHRGHELVVSTVETIARERGMEGMIITFDRHPLETIAPSKAPGLLMPPSELSRLLAGRDLTLLTLRFTPETAAVTAEQWLRIMHEREGVDVLVLGYDNKFGSDGRTMEIADYEALGRKIGIEIVEAPYLPEISSSRIRQLVAEGRVEEASALLGRPFFIRGTVVEGKRQGKSLGFPTANIRPDYRAAVPAPGVYAVEVTLPDATVLPGVANIGYQPTLADNAPLRIEVHIPGFEGDLYGERIAVEFSRRLRDEQKFDSVETLKARIRADIESVLNENNRHNPQLI